MGRAPVVGIVLAAGEGRRAGAPKGLLRTGDGVPWVARAVSTLFEGGCDDVLVVTGARSAEVAALVPAPAVAVEAPDWATGMAASLDRGLTAALGAVPMLDGVLVTLVDTPGVGASVVSRLLSSAGPDVLARATYDGVPGHPVLFGRHHLDAVVASLRGADEGERDVGARAYLARHDVVLVPCEDVGDGRDLDVPPEGTVFPPAPEPERRGFRKRLGWKA